MGLTAESFSFERVKNGAFLLRQKASALHTTGW
jgi:hypothetical protein